MCKCISINRITSHAGYLPAYCRVNNPPVYSYLIWPLCGWWWWWWWWWNPV